MFNRPDLQRWRRSSPDADPEAGRGRARRSPSPGRARVAPGGGGDAAIGDGSAGEGQILVLDDVTPLIRAQKVAAWREVARRLAHEIKNPLTPIQLSAERLKRHFADAPSGARALVDECTSTIVGEVESLKGLVDEFSQFARMPAPRTTPTDLHALIDSGSRSMTVSSRKWIS